MIARQAPSSGRRGASPTEYERRLAEVGELLASRADPAAVVRFAAQRWGLGERAAQKYVAEARRRLREHSAIDRPLQLGMALAGYELLFRRQLKAGELRGARSTLDKLVTLLGLAAPRQEVVTLEVIEREIARLEDELEARAKEMP